MQKSCGAIHNPANVQRVLREMQMCDVGAVRLKIFGSQNKALILLLTLFMLAINALDWLIERGFVRLGYDWNPETV